jgi:hypothetical protein
MGYLGLLFLAAIAAYCAQRAFWRWKTRNQKETRGRYRGGAALGNALQTLQIFVQPRAEYVIAEIVGERKDEEDEGASKDSTAHLLRQAKQIRNGEGVDRLTTLLPP